VQKQKEKVVVLGLGNLLLGDEGAGIHVINKLKKIKLPPHVEIIDGGTSGFKLISIFNEHKNDRFLIIDAVVASAALEIIKNSHKSRHNLTDENTVKNAEKKENLLKSQAAKSRIETGVQEERIKAEEESEDIAAIATKPLTKTEKERAGISGIIEETVSKTWGKEKETFPRTNNKGDIYVVPFDDLYEICPTSYDNKEFISFHPPGLIDIISLLRKTFKIKIKGYLIGINILSPDKGSKTANLKYSLKLSDSIRKKIPDIIGIILKYI